MKVHQYLPNFCVVLLFVSGLFSSCSAYFYDRWTTVQFKNRPEYYLPEKSVKVDTITYEIFDAFKGIKLPENVRIADQHTFKGDRRSLILVRYITFKDQTKCVLAYRINFERFVFGVPSLTALGGAIDLATLNRRNDEISFTPIGLGLDFISWLPLLAGNKGPTLIDSMLPLDISSYPLWLRDYLKIHLEIKDGFQQTGSVLYYVR
jgi:hypothetical protein